MNFIKIQREKLGLSQEALSSLLGMTRRQVANLETGKHKCKKSIAMMLLMLEYFDDEEINKMEIKLCEYGFDIRGGSF
jgi:transcriptional regulator with XRE-family HTH domain